VERFERIHHKSSQRFPISARIHRDYTNRQRRPYAIPQPPIYIVFFCLRHRVEIHPSVTDLLHHLLLLARKQCVYRRIELIAALEEVQLENEKVAHDSSS